jgi:5-methylcytosine-specific restriction protein A
MPSKPKKLCRHPACNQLVDTGYCEQHQQLQSEKRRQYDRSHRPLYHSWYNSKRWKDSRAMFLLSHPLCIKCNESRRLVPATVVDHIKPHKGNYTLFWDTGNWQALCKQCHDAKTVMEDGGFGNKIQNKST